MIDDLRQKFSEGDFVWILISICIGLFFLIMTLQIVGTITGKQQLTQFSNLYLAMPLSISKLQYKPWTIFTNIFVHIGIGHLFFNMLTLYWFGQIYQLYLNNKYVWKVFFGGAFLGCLVVLVVYNFIPYFSQSAANTLLAGASGGILAIIFATTVLNPEHEINLLFVGKVQLRYVAVAMVLLNWVSLIGSNSGGVIAHLGGAIFGWVYMKQIQLGHDLFRISFRRKMRITHSNIQHSQTLPPEYKNSDEEQEKLNKILEKISRSGYDSLSKSDKDFLFHYGKK